MTTQETFDTVARHLLTQGRKSTRRKYGFTTCLYRGPSGRKCAVGCLIPDDMYKDYFEGLSVRMNPELHDLLADLGHDIYLLSALQDIHDGKRPNSWPKALRMVAEAYGISSAVVDEMVAK